MKKRAGGGEDSFMNSVKKLLQSASTCCVDLNPRSHVV